jgi:spore germination protein
VRHPREFVDRISDLQFSLLTVFAVMGGNYLVMPRLVVREAGRDGWLALLLGGILVMLAAGSIARMQARFPGQTAMAYNEQLLGTLLGKGLNLWLLVHFLVAASAQLRLLTDSIKLFLLPQTPPEITMGTMLFVAAYAVRHGINALARLTQVFFPIVLGFLVIIFFLFQTSTDYHNLLPVAAEGWRPLALGTFVALASYQGYGQMIFTMAFLRRPDQGARAVWRGLALVVALYVVTYVIAVAVLGAQHLKGLIYPILDLMRALDFPALLFERVEVLMVVVWLLASYMGLATILYVVSLGSMQLLRLEKHDPLVYLILPAFFLLARVPANLTGLEQLTRLILVSFVLLSLIYAIFLPIIAYFRGRAQNA